MYVNDLARVEMPYPPMLYEALGYDLSGWDVVFFWHGDEFLWSDMTETGFGYAPGWTTFVSHPVVEPKLRGCHFGSASERGRDILLARIPERDFHVGAVEKIDDVFSGGRLAGSERASIEAEVVGLLRLGRQGETTDRDRAIADLTRWLDRLVRGSDAT
jgi:hypothetical protein